APERPAAAAVAALAVALDSLAAQLGPDPTRWTWGRAHRARFAHPLARLDGRAAWEPAPIAADGDNATPCVGASSLPRSVEFGHGPAFRLVVDLARPDLAWGVVPPWNSAALPPRGDLDQLGRWANHGYVALWLDWARIGREARDTLRLEP
ncbi:MAG TPA: penicillin acylase family protein, partial [Candidatus Eisenbacteria bacterium]|nr:penicillin acylase family protein [Candidatus Eisenbacteria bacterium]